MNIHYVALWFLSMLHTIAATESPKKFTPTEKNISDLCAAKHWFGQSCLILLPTDAANAFMFTQFWHEYDWQVMGRYRIQRQDKWAQFARPTFKDRLGLSMKLESWHALIEYGQQDPIKTSLYLLHLWDKPDQELERNEVDLIPLIILKILKEDAKFDSIIKNEELLSQYAKSIDIVEIVDLTAKRQESNNE